MPPIHPVPLAHILSDALPRDRTGLDPEPLAELRRSILDHGLRLPVELFPLPNQPRPDGRLYGLISGYRRLFVFAELAETDPAFAAIPALIREGLDAAAAYRAMVEENAVRAPLSPWETGRAVAVAVAQGFHPCVETAADALHPGATRQKRARLRAVARLFQELDGLLATPERISENRLMDLSEAWRAGYADAIVAALEATAGGRLRPASADRQWAALAPLLDERAEERANPGARSPCPGRPRRVLEPRPGLVIRRERTADGWLLRFTGPEATSPLLDTVLDTVERLYAPG
jgi:ParB family chromosome partitioning protein